MNRWACCLIQLSWRTSRFQPGLVVAPHPHRHQNRLHQATATAVVIGVCGEPQGQAEEGKNARAENQFGHGVKIC